MNNMKYVLLSLACAMFLCGCTNVNEDKKFVGLANPWIDCKTDSACAAQKAGFEFPVEAENSNFRAMDSIVEVTFPLDGTKPVTLRKGILTDIDLSGDYKEYPDSYFIKLPEDKDVSFFIRAEKDKIYVVNFENFKHSYSISSPDGLTIDNVKQIYEIVKKAENRTEQSETAE